MDETASPAQVQTPIAVSDQSQYWCYHCDKRVSVETLTDQPAVVCSECKFGFVESIPAPPAFLTVSSPSLSPPFGLASDGADFGYEPTLGSCFLQVMRLLAQVAREEGIPPPAVQNPVDPPSNDDFLRIELRGSENGNENFEEEGDEEENDKDEHSVEIRNEESEDQSENEIEVRQIENLEESEEDT